MKLFSICNVCKKRKLLIKKRYFKIPYVKDPITSQNELCGKCAKGIGRNLPK